MTGSEYVNLSDVEGWSNGKVFFWQRAHGVIQIFSTQLFTTDTLLA